MRDAQRGFTARLILAATIFIYGFSTASAQPKPVAAKPDSTPTAANDALQTAPIVALSTRLDLDFAETPLLDVIGFLQEQTGVTFVLRSKKLEEAGVSVDVPVDAHHRQIRLETWLTLALDELDLTWMEQDDLIVITTPEDAEMHLVTRVYDCKDLLAIPKLANIVSEPMAESEANGVPALEADATNAKGPPVEQESKSAAAKTVSGFHCSTRIAPKRPADPAEHLMEIVTQAIDIQSWDEVGGPGTIGEYRGLLVVTQTDRVHKKVAHLLDMLREAAGLEVPQTGKVVR